VRILVIEDEPKVGKALQEALQVEDYDVTLATTGEEGFFLASSQPFDLIVLDILLPGRDGIEVLNTLRKRGMRVPVIMLTARDAIEDRVGGLDAGADDYLVKPFAFAELSARIRALLRRGKPEAPAPVRIDTLEMWDSLRGHLGSGGHAARWPGWRRSAGRPEAGTSRA
jgi:two-component system, OmpR family, copper resistance phosphate regulon response regulator CusR